MAKVPKGKYEGRLMCDGNGNLLADQSTKVGDRTITLHDEFGAPVKDDQGNNVTLTIPVFEFGDHHGFPVAHDPDAGEYVFVQRGEPSHNDRHHEQFTEPIGATQVDDPDGPWYAGEEDDPVEGREHHWRALPDDDHYEEGATNEKGVVTNTREKKLPDTISPFATGHTEAYT